MPQPIQYVFLLIVSVTCVVGPYTHQRQGLEVSTIAVQETPSLEAVVLWVLCFRPEGFADH